MPRWPRTTFLDEWATERRRSKHRRRWQRAPDDELREQYEWRRDGLRRLRVAEDSIRVAEDHLYDHDLGALLLGPNADWAHRLRGVRYKLERERDELSASVTDLESVMFERAVATGVTLSKHDWLEHLHAERQRL